MVLRACAALTLSAVSAMTVAMASDPTATDYSYDDCQGSLRPYPSASVHRVPVPDSLVPVYLSHVGRHGSRYPAGSGHTLMLQRALRRADSLGTITPLGRRLQKLVDRVEADSRGRWGSLDSLGMAEQRGLAGRMFETFPDLFTNGTINAISSYSPRAMMSMMSFVHQLDEMDNRLTFTTLTGHCTSALMRPFDTDTDYKTFIAKRQWAPAYNSYFAQTCPLSGIQRVLGSGYPYGSEADARDLAIVEYYVLAGLEAMQLPGTMDAYLTRSEANALWSCFNLRQYLVHTASTVSTVPADIASALVLDIVQKADNALAGTNPAVVDLRFGHAETVMPLVSLLRLPGCYYLTNYFDTVARNWHDFHVVPMAANVQMVLLRSAKTGRVYLRTDLNEVPVPLIAGDSRIYVPWAEARAAMLARLPVHLTL